MALTTYDKDEIEQINGIKTAADNKFYMLGGSGKEFVYNPTTNNIGVNQNGAIRYVMVGDSDYDLVFSAMEADTGLKFRSNNMGYSLSEQLSANNRSDMNNSQITALRGKGQAELDAVSAQVNKYLDDLAVKKAKTLTEQSAANTKLYAEHAKTSDPYGNMGEKLAMMGLSSSGYADSEQQKLLDKYNALMEKNKLSAAEVLAELERAGKEALVSGQQAKAKISEKYYALISEQMLLEAQAKAAAVQPEKSLSNGSGANMTNAANISTPAKVTGASEASSSASQPPSISAVTATGPKIARQPVSASANGNNVSNNVSDEEEQQERRIYYSPEVALQLLSSGEENASLISSIENYYHAPYEILKSFPQLKIPSDYSIAVPESLPFKVSNNMGKDWIYIPMLGRFSFTELLNKLAKGEIKCTVKDGVYSFVR